MTKTKDKKPRKKRTSYRRREYTEAERLAVLDTLKSNDGAVSKTAQETGVPIQTVAAWASGFRHPRTLQLWQASGGDLAHTAENIAWEIAAIIPDRIHEAPLNHLATAFGTMVEKMRILRDQPTTIADQRNTAKDADSDKIKELVGAMTFDERQQLRKLFESAAGRVDNQPRQVASGT